MSTTAVASPLKDTGIFRQHPSHLGVARKGYGDLAWIEAWQVIAKHSKHGVNKG
jgi:hypothetical protein